MHLFFEKMKITFAHNKNNIVISVFFEDNLVSEYRCIYQKKLNDNGLNLLKATLLSWATLDFSICEKIEIDMPLSNFEMKYVVNHFDYCTKLYSKVYNYKPAIIVFSGASVNTEYIVKEMKDQFYLGYTEGKDSSLCRELIKRSGKGIEYYKVSYDDEMPAEDGHIYTKIIDYELYNKYTITGWKANRDIVSFQQADDIHVTFACPYAYERDIYPDKLAVGIPWDAIHAFSSGEPDIVPTETYQSILILESLVHNYGYKDFKIISPIASLHTYGVYAALERLSGLDKLVELDSCWESYAYSNKNCGFCPKCQRLKKVFQDCFDYDNNTKVPLLNIVSADFLFGSVYATRLLEDFSPKEIMNTMFLDQCSVAMSGEFIDILKRIHNYQVVNDIVYTYTEDDQKWDDIMSEIVNALEINYDSLSDVAINSENVPYLPFEKYYKWNRKNKVLNCYSSVGFHKDEESHVKSISEGNAQVDLPQTDIFQFYLSNTSFFAKK